MKRFRLAQIDLNIVAAKNLKLLDDVAEKWGEVASSVPSPMLDYSWARACLETLYKEDEFHLVRTESQSGLSAIAPLIKRRNGLPRLILIGSDELFEPMDLFYADLSSLDRLATALVEIGLPIDLFPLPASSPAIESIKRAYRGRGVVLCRAADTSPVIRIDGSGRDPEQYLNAGRRSDLRRMRRRAEKLGTVTTEICVPRRDEVDALLDEAFSVELKSWKGRAGTALASDARLGDFFRRYAAAATEAGLLRIFLLRIAGKAAAMQIAVERNGTLWLLKMGHDEVFRKCAPGQLLMLDVLRNAVVRGLSSIELGTTDEWSRAWTKETREYVSVRAYPANAIGAAVFAVDAARSLRNKISRRLPRKGEHGGNATHARN